MPVLFFFQNIPFALKRKSGAIKIILSVIRKEKKKAGDINFIFCNDKFILFLNKKHLKHNTLTDILTFQYSSERLSGEIFISIPRVKENAKKYNVSFDNELYRIMIHGVLHLCGYKDKSALQKKIMRKKEDYYLKFLK